MRLVLQNTEAMGLITILLLVGQNSVALEYGKSNNENIRKAWL